MLLGSHIGEASDAMVTGASETGTWVRIQQPAAKGRLVEGTAGLGVGNQVDVRLVRTDVAQGFIDFARSR
jgi:hypothetical protein